MRSPPILMPLIATVLAACGTETMIPPPVDDPADTFTIGGTIAGQDAAVTLSLNGASQTFDANTFTFTTRLELGAPYAVLFVSSASGQSCQITNGIGIVGGNVTDVSVSCSTMDPVLRYDDAEVTGNLGVGDFDGDGAPDLVFTIRTLPGHAIGNNLDMYRLVFGAGDGTYGAPLDVARIGSSDTNERGRHFVVSDFDGDGIEDFAYSSGNGLEVFTVGASRTPQRVFGPGSPGSPLSGLDADGNGTTDLISIVWGGSILDYFNLYRGNGDGTFQAEEFIGNRDDAGAQAIDMGAPLNMTVGDFNGDGDDDIAALVLTGPGSDLSLAVAILAGDGSGTFAYPTAMSPVSDDVFEGFFAFELASKELEAGDIDGDGDTDLVLTSTTNFVLLLDNDGTGLFTESGRVTVRLRPIHVRLADFDGDTELDILTANADSRDLTIAFGDGAGGFGGPSDGEDAWRTLPLDSDVEIYDIWVTDLDGEGALDVAVAEDGTNPPDTGRGSVQLLLAPGS